MESGHVEEWELWALCRLVWNGIYYVKCVAWVGLSGERYNKGRGRIEDEMEVHWHSVLCILGIGVKYGSTSVHL